MKNPYIAGWFVGLIVLLLGLGVPVMAQDPCPAGSSMGQTGICIPNIAPAMQAGAADLMAQVNQMWPFLLGLFLAVVIAPTALRSLWDRFMGKGG